MHVHHVDRDRKNNDPGNLKAAHPTCHTSWHAKQPRRLRRDRLAGR